MNNEFITELESKGVDVKTALARFMGNVNIYKKFLIKFPDDENFKKIKTAIDAKDKDAAFMAAHTVKGVAANLGRNPISSTVEKIVEIFRRANEYPNDPNIEALYDEAEKNYIEICDIISKYSQ